MSEKTICPQCGYHTDKEICPECGYNFKTMEPNMEKIDENVERILTRYNKNNLVDYLMDILPNDAKKEILSNYTQKRKLDQEKIREYIEEGGDRCPYCGATSLDSSGKLEMNNGEVTLVVMCLQCRRAWRDVYSLTTIEEVEE